jgi:uncharacterized membrane protein
MWSRERFKSRAKQVLKGNYWLTLGGYLTVSVIVWFASVIVFTIFEFVLVAFGVGGGFAANSLYSIGYSLGAALAGGVLFLIAYLLLYAVIFGIVIFLSSPLQVGFNKFLLESRKGNRSFENVFSSFNKKRYSGVVKGMAWQVLFTFLWTLLFCIPGIIKTFSYYAVPYILADNPKIDYRRALKLSMKMTDGYKLDIFALELSFIGWVLLGEICCFIGVAFITPYIAATNAEMYAHIRKNALEKGYCTPDELNLTEIDFNLDYHGQM